MFDLTRILCPVDFSAATPFGVGLGEALSRRFGARITLMHVLPRLAFPFRMPVDSEAVYDQWEAEAGERLKELAADSRLRGANVATHLTRGNPYNQIGLAARELDAELIVMPTHSRAGLDRLLYGSVTERVVRTATCPVLTAPPTIEGLESFEPRRILVATDFSPAAQPAYETALELARAYVAELVIGHVFSYEHLSDEGAEWWRPTLTKEQVERAVEEATRRLDKLAARAQREGVTASTDLSQGSNPAAEIVRLATDQEADLVVVASRGQGMLKHMLLGSTTEKLIRSCPSPLMTVPAAVDEEAGATIPTPVPA